MKQAFATLAAVRHPARIVTLSLFVFLVFLAMPRSAAADEIRFGIQPILDQKRAALVYLPLAQYLSQKTGQQIQLKTSYDFADYWFRLKKGTEFDLVLDGPFYTDYLIQEQKFIPLVKVPGVVSYTLAGSPLAGYFEPSDLIGKKIATLIPPAPAGLLLAKMFPHPSRQPYIVPTKSSGEALQLLTDGKVDAAMVPTPLVGRAMSEGREIATIVVTKQVPHITLSASPKLNPSIRAKIKQILLEAMQNDQGKEVVTKVGFREGFEEASADIYIGYSGYLNQAWDSSRAK